MTEAEEKEHDEALKKALALLSERFEAIQILASFQYNGKTTLRSIGTGNWYARQGMAHEFINENNSDLIGVGVANHIKSKDDDET